MMRTEPPAGDDLERMVARIRERVDRAVTAQPHHAARAVRTGIVIGLASLLGLGLMGGAVALGITLNQQNQPPVQAPVPTVTMTPAPTPTVTATPTSTSNAGAAPSVRVPTTCEALTAGIDLRDQYGRLTLAAGVPWTYSDPYVDARAGYLSCTMRSAASADPSTGYSATGALVFSVVIAPNVSDAAFEERINSAANWPEAAPADGYGPDTHRYKVPDGVNANFAGFVDRVEGYGVLATGWVADTAVGVSADQQKQIATAYSTIYPRVAALGAPASLWEPPSGAIRGAADCPDLATTDQLNTLFGGTWHSYKSSGGENEQGVFRASQLVGAYSCSWATDGFQMGVHAGVLPGGASYFADAQHASNAPKWQRATSLPGEAYVTPDGTRAAILIDGNWVDVSVSDRTKLPAFVDVVLKNVGVAH